MEKQNKAAFKKHIKEQIRKQIEAVIKEEACEKTKMRFLQNERFEEKEYMKQCSFKEYQQIMRLRLNMVKAKANFGGQDGEAKCPAECNEEDTTEHLLTCEKLDAICHKMEVKNIHTDIKSTEWLKRSAMKIKHRENIKTLPYGEN